MTDGPLDRVKAYVLIVYTWLRDEVIAARDEIAPQLRGLSVPTIPKRAVKPLVLAGVLIIAAVVAPAAPFTDSADVEREDPVEGETFEPVDDGPSLNGVTLNQLPGSYLDSGDEAPDPPQSVRASAGSQTMEVETAMVDGEPAIVLEDDRTHDGRWVSLDTSWFEQHLGDVPSVAYVEHEDGTEYAEPLQVRGDSAAFYVREFSTNTVTFDGEVRLSGDEAADGSQYQYELNSTDGVDDPSINLTGTTSTQWDNVTRTDIENGDTVNVDVGGNAEPFGPSSNSQPVIEITGFKSDINVVYQDTNSNLKIIDASGNVEDLGVQASDVSGIGDLNGDGDFEVAYQDSSDNLKIVDASGNVNDLGVDPFFLGGEIGDFDGDGDLDIPYRASNDDLKLVDASGNVQDTGKTGYQAGGIADFDSDGDAEVAYRGTNDDLEIVDASGNVEDLGVQTNQPGGIADIDSDGDLDIAYRDTNENVKIIDPSGNVQDLGVDAKNIGGIADLDSDGDLEVAYKTSNNDLKIVDASGNVNDLGEQASDVGGAENIAGVSTTKDPEIDIDGDGTNEVSISGKLTGTTTREIPSLAVTDDTFDVSLKAGKVDATLKVKERTQTKDPVVELNGETVGVDGTLTDGETVQLDANASALQNGTNRVNISTSSPSSGPASLVGFEYTHGAETTVEGEVSETTWRQTANVSKTWPSDRANATATIPLNDRVVNVRTVEVRYNGTSWQSTSDYTLNGTDLTVELGDIPAGSTTAVRATGQKVRVTDGVISVTDPTEGGDRLYSTIRVDAAGPDFALQVGNTEYANRVHYATNATWGETAATSAFDSSGQTVTLPNAEDGGKTTVKTWPIEVSPAAGSVTVTNVTGDRSEAGIEVTGDGTDEVDYTFLNASDATPYVLYSTTNDIVRDEGLASSPITLTDDNSEETLVFQVDDGSASGSDSGGSGAVSSVTGAVGPMAGSGSVLGQLTGLLPGAGGLLAILVGLGAVVVAGRRTGVITDDRVDTATDVSSSVATRGGALVERALGNELVITALLLGGAAWLLQSELLPGRTRIIIALAMVPVAMFLALQRFDRFDVRVWAGSTALIGVFGLQLLAPSFFSTIAEEAGIIIVVGVIALGWRALSAWRAEANTPDEVTNLEIEATEEDD